MSSRDRLLEAAITVIEEHGEVGIRVDEIAATADVAKPSLYHFYGSRDGLVAAAQAERYRRSLLVGVDDVVARIEDCTSAAEFEALLRAWIASFTSEEGRRRRAIRLDVLGSSVSRPALQAEVDRANNLVTETLAELLARARANGWVLTDSDLDPVDVALWLHGLWNGRYLCELAGDPTRAEGWDHVTITALERLLFGER